MNEKQYMAMEEAANLAAYPDVKVEVFFETPDGPLRVAVFEDHDLYVQVLPALEKVAHSKGYLVSEFVINQGVTA